MSEQLTDCEKKIENVVDTIFCCAFFDGDGWGGKDSYGFLQSRCCQGKHLGYSCYPYAYCWEDYNDRNSCWNKNCWCLPCRCLCYIPVNMIDFFCCVPLDKCFGDLCYPPRDPNMFPTSKEGIVCCTTNYLTKSPRDGKNAPLFEGEHAIKI